MFGVFSTRLKPFNQRNCHTLRVEYWARHTSHVAIGKWHLTCLHFHFAAERSFLYARNIINLKHDV
jgi:hypothetical protein